MQQNTPFTVQADHNGQNVDGYRLKVNGQIVQEQPASALVNGTITFAHTDGLPKGQYIVTVSAFNADGETEASPVTLVITGVPPAAPVNVRFAVL